MESTQRSSVAEELNVPEERVGQYARIEEIGRGGQSAVWLALDGFLGREVAVKEILPLRGDEPHVTALSAALQRFLREARVTARLDHPSIVPIYELARRANGALLCAQKLIRGETLKSRLAACKSLDDRLALLPHLIDACQAIAYAHSRGVIHRDLKPSNIMVGEFGETVVVDWGLAKQRGQADDFPGMQLPAEPDVTAAGKALGTPAYMSPEQVRGAVAEMDERSDVFGLGVVLYELLTARLPFEGDDSAAVMNKVLEGKFRPVREVCPEAPAELAAVAERALQHDPARRYGGAEPLAKELTAYRAGARVGAYRYGTWDLLRRFAASHRALLTGGAIAIGAVLVAVTVVAVRLHQARIDLAASFRERAYRAQQEGDWSKAAAYFAAARVQHDTSEERWGLAGADERVAERILSLQGAAETFTDVGTLQDGRVVALGHSSGRIEVREAETGKTLWAGPDEPGSEPVLLPGGLLRISHSDRWTYHDAATGRELSAWPRAAGVPCPGRYPPNVGSLDRQLLLRENGGATRVIAADAVLRGLCAVSEDGRQVAYHESSSYGLRWLSLPDGKELGRHKVDRFRRLHFTKHGLVVLLQGRVEVMSAPEKGFAIDLPEARFGSSQPLNFDNDKGDSAFSSDGDLVAMSSGRGESHAVVVDLRSRSLRAILHHPPGRPRLAFSLDGLRVFAANLKNGSTLSGWRLPVEDLPKKPRWWKWGALTSNGRAAALWDDVSGRVELFRPVDKLVLSGVRSTGFKYNLLGDGALDAFVSIESSEAILRDLEKDQVVWRRPCRLCKDISVSEDGVHFALIGADGLEVWNTRTGQRLFLETRRVRPEAPVITIANDGRRLAWGFVDQVILRDMDTAREQALPSDGALHDLKFSPDGSRLAATGTANTTLWDAVTGRVLWSVPRDVPDAAVLRWSLDGRALLLDHAYTVHELLDVASGERLAWFETLGPPITPVMAAMYAPDLRVKAVASFTSWERRPVPQPDESVPEQSLARTMRRTGLAFRGVDLVAAP